VPPIKTDRHKVMQILVNLLSNAKYAMDECDGTRQMVVKVSHNQTMHQLEIAVIDNGVGISAENLTRVFSHGFTTKKEGHGFGLHSGALAAKELGGTLTAHSDGPGKGAVFTLTLPLQQP
jgi:C4-dicarboxylate-specific signal transduction histidine kinase